MGSELSWRHSATGKTVYATIRSAARTYWSTEGTPALEALTVANWDHYDIALAEAPASSYFYVGSWPAGLTTVGFYWVDVYEQAGGSPAIGDTFMGTLVGYWNGTALLPWAGEAGSDLETLISLGNTASAAAQAAAEVAIASRKVTITSTGSPPDYPGSPTGITYTVIGTHDGKPVYINAASSFFVFWLTDGAKWYVGPVHPDDPALDTELCWAQFTPDASPIGGFTYLGEAFDSITVAGTYPPYCLEVDGVDVTKWKGATAPAMSGDAYAVVNHATYGNSALHTDVADVHTDVGTALTNIADLHTDVGTAISQTTAATLVTALWDLADGIEIDLTPRQAARAVVARAGFGLISGAGTGVETVKGAGVTTTRLVLTDDSSGNITAAAATLT